MAATKEKMSAYFAVFNCHVNNAEQRAKLAFRKKFGPGVWNVKVKPLITTGIMAIFHHPPNEWTRFFVDKVTEFVNEDRE